MRCARIRRHAVTVRVPMCMGECLSEVSAYHSNHMRASRYSLGLLVFFMSKQLPISLEERLERAFRVTAGRAFESEYDPIPVSAIKARRQARLPKNGISRESASASALLPRAQ